MSVNAASASARSASCATTSMSLPMTFSTRTPSDVELAVGGLVRAERKQRRVVVGRRRGGGGGVHGEALYS